MNNTNSPTATSDGAGSAELARMMLPSDANIAGNVHGGTIMQLMEEAAGVAAHRYFCQSHSSPRVVPLVSRVERLSFQHPIHVGDVAKVKATVIFSSLINVAVCVQVRAERLAWSTRASQSQGTHTDTTSGDTVCNRALMWLVGAELPPISSARLANRINPSNIKRALAPPFPIPKDKTSWAWEQYQEAAQLYEKNQGNKSPSVNTLDITSDNLMNNAPTTPRFTDSTIDEEGKTPNRSAVELAQVMLPSDCVNTNGLVSGGVVMKLMDNACGIVAVRHCGTNTVTVVVQGVNLFSPVLSGDVLMVQARPVFTSAKSIEIAVSVRAERYNISNSFLHQEIVAITDQAYFTFVALPLGDKNPSALPMIPLRLETKEDRETFEKRKAVYQQRRALIGSSRRIIFSKL